ncbi:MAG TPA: hypothetical protein VFM05_10555 [Candidatus Saccharimonadales bacterium]|nr:hypothetical protein [Candidatus Saccharimonadales bacterium]
MNKVSSAISDTAYSWADSNIIWQRVRRSALCVPRYNSRNAVSSARDKRLTYLASGIDTCFLAISDSMPIPKNLPAFI